MAMQINDVKLAGNLTKEPELRYTPGGTQVTDISLAVNERYNANGEQKQVTTFVDVQVWGNSAENLSKLARKGQEIFVEGSLRQDTWDDKATGKKRSRMFVNADRWQFVQNKTTELARERAREGAEQSV